MWRLFLSKLSFTNKRKQFYLGFLKISRILISGLREFLTIESPLKLMENAFISPQKLFSFSRNLDFCLDHSIMQQNNLIRKIRLISNSMASQSGKQTIVIHILPNISRSRGNQTIKFGQLIEYNIRQIFLETS